MVQLSFIKEKKRMANAHTKKLDLSNERSYFKKHPVSNKKFSNADNIKMLEIVIDNISVIFGGCAFNSQHSCGLTVHLLANLFLYSYEACIMKEFLMKTKRS